jgi:uncharacterized membrane protein YhaH (DUF805 family)
MNWYLKVLKEYVNFSGRASRTEYWMFTLFNILAAIAFTVIVSLIKLPEIAMLYSLATLLPSIAVAVRRLHDTNRSGWMLLVSLIPIAGLYVLYLMIVDSDAGNNNYGPNPKANA